MMSAATAQLPEEVLAAQTGANTRAPDELNKQERKRKRAHKKAVAKKRTASKVCRQLLQM